MRRWWRICLFALLLQACGSTAAPRLSYLPRGRRRRHLPPTQRPYSIAGKSYRPLASEQGFVQEGIASWYGGDFHGRLTASGEVYDMYAQTAAHKTLPMNTYVRVTNLRNKRRLVVRINDRGPFVKGRILDLSYAAARKLGMVEQGTAPVRLQALGRKVVSPDKKVTFVPLDFNRGNFTVQVGAFREKVNAERLVKRLAGRYPDSHWVVFDSGRGRFYRVRAGRYRRLRDARDACERLGAAGFPDAFIVAE